MYLAGPATFLCLFAVLGSSFADKLENSDDDSNARDNHVLDAIKHAESDDEWEHENGHYDQKEPSHPDEDFWGDGRKYRGARPEGDFWDYGDKYKGLRIDGEWPEMGIRLGQIGGIAADDMGKLFVFQRNSVVWDDSSFDSKDNYLKKDKGPIKDATIYEFDEFGILDKKFGENRFYMPHGLTLDRFGNFWMTDVALHQVFKWPASSPKPTMVLGEKFVPGTDDSHFCKPTDVAVASNGHFFVSDGYCNSRILKFDKDGKVLTKWGKDPDDDDNPKDNEFLIPHSLALIEQSDILCVADRENGRIQCFNAGLEDHTKTGEFLYSITDPRFGKVFAIEYDENSGVLYAVNGRTKDIDQVSGFTIDLDSQQVIDEWTPQRNGQGFQQPHDVTTDGRSVFVGEIGPNMLWKFNKL
ncbi:putative peptidyl-alpha-hydroxyglycine alpha-amidating lyase pgal-1 [Tubulanus polymorphus]|uniref:putative peptidyl-alpha-hydroxyglycine alpha-amidating lyase pgal-1 n=1 Tax=Tubulanus polymorphus TaxID=672921 RepID=UPI003DA66551